MGTLKQKVQAALQTKAAIKTALIGKGQNITDTTKFSDYPAVIDAISTGADTSDGNITPMSVLSGKIGYAASGRVVGKLPSRTASSISVDGASLMVPSGYYQMSTTKSVTRSTRARPTLSQNGNIITARVTQGEGYVDAGEETASLTLPSAGAVTGGTMGSTTITNSNGVTGSGTITVTGLRQSFGHTDGMTNGSMSVSVPAGKMYAARSIIPSTENQTAIAAGGVANGNIIVGGDPNLAGYNIRSGIRIFGVLGTMAPNDAGFVYVNEPPRQYIMNVPWPHSHLPRAVVGFWHDRVTLDGNGRKYFVYAFSIYQNEMCAEYEDRNGVYHDTIPYNMRIIRDYLEIEIEDTDLGLCNGNWCVGYQL